MGARYIIRTAMPADESRVTELLTASYDTLLRAAYDAGAIAAVLPHLGRANPGLLQSGRFFLAESEEDGLLGCGGWSAERPGTGELEAGLAHVRHFATRPDRTRSGIGRAIYAKCVETAGAAGITRFECCASLNAEGFYAALGFRTAGRFEIPMGNIAMPCLVMKREISSANGPAPGHR